MAIPEIFNFERDWCLSLSSLGRVVVLFFATWSPIDRKLAVSLEHLISEYEGTLVFLCADVDKVYEKDASFLHSIELYTVPTLILFKNGELAERSVGYLEEAKLCGLLQTWAQK